MCTVKEVTGNILDSPAEAIVNPVNCVGVMGKGLALQFKERYPSNFSYYQAVCNTGKLVPGKMLVYTERDVLTSKYVINFPTKRHWRDKSLLEDIDLGLNSLVKEVEKRGIKSIAIPPLGCGLGGLDYTVVKQVICKHFNHLEGLTLHLYQPY